MVLSDFTGASAPDGGAAPGVSGASEDNFPRSSRIYLAEFTRALSEGSYFYSVPIFRSM